MPGKDAPPSEQATTTRQLTLIADVVRKPGGIMAANGSTLIIEPTAGSALLAFEPPTGNCTQAATLRVRTSSTDIIATEVRRVEAWVSLETDVATLPDGSSLGAQVVAPGSPMVSATLADDVLIWDITELVNWATTHQVGAKAFVVVVKPFFGADASPVELAAMEGSDHATLEVVEDQRCIRE
ncbi:MAG TPA: hypothetical protein VL068_12370, partial [Microthrixaceae bacterium]|nr:hypothetical protein [Microthrixaceae bacterium]